jgi:hypothetical protein
MINIADIVDFQAYNKTKKLENEICEKLEYIGVAKPKATTSNFISVCTFYFWARLTEEGEKYPRNNNYYLKNIGARDGVWQILYGIFGNFDLLEEFERNLYISLVGNDDGYELPLNLNRVKGE